MKLLRSLVLSVLILAAALPVLAQEAVPEATAESASQVYFPTTLLLLMGIGAVLVVGAVVVMRERSQHEVD
ncbi:MAG: hypothetical protein JNM70_14835 [Anaerolineae bacterium]|nr:hypothetical protein [Anaerolineae bacterium]